MPDGCRGFIVAEDVDSTSKWKVESEFDSVIYWKCDEPPSQRNALSAALDWMAVADAVGAVFVLTSVFVCAAVDEARRSARPDSPCSQRVGDQEAHG